MTGLSAKQNARLMFILLKGQLSVFVWKQKTLKCTSLTLFELLNAPWLLASFL